MKPKFNVGDEVEKCKGYEYPGYVVAVFENRKGGVRYVVESLHSMGMLHIFNEGQLEEAKYTF